MKFLVPAMGGLVAALSACSSTPSDPATFDELFVSFSEIDALADTLTTSTPAEVAAASDNATYDGLAYVRNYTNANTGNSSGLDFMALGEASVDVNLDTQ